MSLSTAKQSSFGSKLKGDTTACCREQLISIRKATISPVKGNDRLGFHLNAEHTLHLIFTTEEKIRLNYMRSILQKIPSKNPHLEFEANAFNRSAY